VVGEVREYDELAAIYEKLDTVRITTSPGGKEIHVASFRNY